MKTKWNLIAGTSLVFIALGLWAAALQFQTRLNDNNDLLSQARTMPPDAYHSITSWNDWSSTTIPFLVRGGVVLFIVGFCLCLFSKLKALKPLKASLLICVLLISTPALTLTSSAGGGRWYAALFLEHPLDATGILGIIWIYNNSLSTQEDAFVAFMLGIMRVKDRILQEQEWLEVGYFQNHTDSFIYAASLTLNKGYKETAGIPLCSLPTSIKDWFCFEIQQKHGNTFEAAFYALLYVDGYPDYRRIPLTEMTFTLGGDNYCMAVSESNYTANTLKAHYSGLLYKKQGVKYQWSEVFTDEDFPYYVRMVSAHEFYTDKLRWKNPDVNNDGRCDIVDFLTVAGHLGENDGYDLNYDGCVDIDDVMFVGCYFGMDRPKDEDLPYISWI